VGRSVHLGHWDEPPASAAPAPGEFERAQDRLDDVLLGMADLRDGQSLLDVGCGFGGSLQKVNDRHHAMRLAGVNVDARQIEICRQLQPREDNTLAWAQADACALPFPDATFDRVLCIEAMFHFASRQAFFLESARVLRPGGALVLSDMFLAPSALALDLPGFCVEAILRDGYGPWPDVWGDDLKHTELGRAAGLDCTRSTDATRHTRRSHRFTVPPHAGERHDPGDPGLRAGMLLRWLHERGHLAYVYLRFDKPGARRP
jgi:SAM-dependent methyltransferase